MATPAPAPNPTPKPGVSTKPEIHPVQTVTSKFPKSKTEAVLPWAVASLGAIILGDVVVRGSNPNVFNPKQYLGWAFVFLVILLLPEEIGAVFAPLVFVGILVAHHEFLTKSFKKTTK